MQTPQKIIQRKHLQHLTTAHWTCSTAAAVGVGHENGNNLYTSFNSSSLRAFLQKKGNHVTAYCSLSFVSPCMIFKTIFVFLQTEALPPANENVCYDSIKRPAAGATFEHLDCRSKNIASTI